MKKEKLGKRIQASYKLVDSRKSYTLNDAIALIGRYGETCKAKFDETVDLIFKLGVDAKDTNNAVRGAVPMPHGLGKNIRVAVFTKPERVKEAKEAGADIYGADELIEEVKGGKLDFDVCIATPDMMGALAKVGRVLGPKGLMPNPKLGTVSEDIKGSVQRAKKGQAEFKTDKGSIVHAPVGKISFEAKALRENILAFDEAVKAAKPSNAKGIYMKGAFLSTTMGFSIRLDLASLVG